MNTELSLVNMVLEMSSEITELKDINQELLEALKDVCQAIAWTKFGECRGWSDSAPLTIQDALAKAKQVIDKAIGGQA
jgi:hypothetical protein